MSEYTNLSPSGHFLFDVARSNIAEARAVNLFGYNADVGTDYETIWNFGGLYARPSSAVVMSVTPSTHRTPIFQIVDALSHTSTSLRMLALRS